jgi:hypothetical protein
MSYDEKVSQNKFRVSKVVSIGDLITIVACLGVGFNMWFSIKDHEKRLTAIEVLQTEQTKTLAHHDTQIAVIQGAIKEQAQ